MAAEAPARLRANPRGGPKTRVKVTPASPFSASFSRPGRRRRRSPRPLRRDEPAREREARRGRRRVEVEGRLAARLPHRDVDEIFDQRFVGLEERPRAVAVRDPGDFSANAGGEARRRRERARIQSTIARPDRRGGNLSVAGSQLDADGPRGQRRGGDPKPLERALELGHEDRAAIDVDDVATSAPEIPEARTVRRRLDLRPRAVAELGLRSDRDDSSQTIPPTRRSVSRTNVALASSCAA